jgi:dethiobiotin synthetase
VDLIVEQHPGARRVHGLFVTGTDTGAGKSVLCASLLAAIAAAGRPVLAHKPILTGLAEPPADWPADHELLGAAAGMEPAAVAPLRFAAPASPHLAASLEGRGVDFRSVVSRAREVVGRAERAGGIAVVEGIGGLLVPLDERHDVRDLARALRLPLLVAARPGLGTINHTLLTIEAARAGGLDVRAVVLTPWPTVPTAIERSNRATLERLGEVEVAALPALERPDRRRLARAGDALPWRQWLQAQPQRDAAAPSSGRGAARARAEETARAPLAARAAASIPAVSAASSSSPIT